jgi:2-dehydrotetronate isomerase
MPKFAANLSFLFTELPFLDRFEAAEKAGFKAVEYLSPFEAPKAEIAARLKAHDLKQALFNMAHGDASKGERGMSAIPGRETEFAKAVEAAIDYATTLGCKRLFAMAGLRHHGATRAAYVANLKTAVKMCAPHGIDVIIEPINTRDIPGYFLNLTEDARSIIHEVAAPNIGLQFDIYHRQVMQGDVIMAIREFGPLARHYQIANPPDRGEPDEGEINYRSVFAEIDKSGYAGFIGCEYRPRNGTVAGLGWPARLGVTLG